MNVSEVITSKVDLDFSSAVKVSGRTIRELGAIAKERGLPGYFGLYEAELVSLLGASMRPEPKKSLSRVKSNARSLTNPTFTEVRDGHKMQLRCKPTEKNSFELRGKTRSAAKSELSELGEWCEFLEEQIRVSDAARMCLHLWEMWVTALIELLFRGDRGAGRSQRSADALVGMTALVELLFL